MPPATSSAFAIDPSAVRAVGNVWDVRKPPNPSFRSSVAVLAILAVLLAGCATEERRGIRLTPTSTVETGVRVLVDNCPGPTSLTLSVRDDVLWEISNSNPEAADTTAAADGTTVIPEPGIQEFLVGQPPDGWVTVAPLTVPLEPGIRYTIQTLPDRQSIDFATPDLQPGLLWDGEGVIQFNPDLINEECSEPADFGKFAENLLFLVGLGVTSSALVLVVLILVLFVITRRFSRVRSLQKQAERERVASGPPGPEQP